MKKIVTFLCFNIIFSSRYLEAQQIFTRAYVNDHVITDIDVANRRKIFMVLGHIDQDEPSLIHMLIDEEIILQVAKDSNSTLNIQQIDTLKQKFALQVGFQNYHDFVKKYKIDSDSLHRQLESGYLIEYFIKPKIDINQYYIQSNMSSLKNNQAVQKENFELQLSQLLISKESKQFTEIQRNVKDKIPFTTIVKSYSGAQQYELESLKLHQLRKSIRKSVVGRKVGDVVGPIYLKEKILFLRINDIKRLEVDNEQMHKSLLNAQLQVVVREFIAKCRGKAFIKIV